MTLFGALRFDYSPQWGKNNMIYNPFSIIIFDFFVVNWILKFIKLTICTMYSDRRGWRAYGKLKNKVFSLILYTQLLNKMLTNELQCRADNNLMKYEIYEHILPAIWNKHKEERKLKNWHECWLSYSCSHHRHVLYSNFQTPIASSYVFCLRFSWLQVLVLVKKIESP